ncbi:MAG TPA: aldehyde reductase [Streptosporangiaceae bacterium]|nr:aldehyde reductase [Streptosporangiaceae bacterium]
MDADPSIGAEHTVNAEPAGSTVLVTGGSGYLARWCIRGLLDRGCTVHATVRNLSTEAGLRSLFPAAEGGQRLRVFAADLLSDDGWKEAADGCDYVLHTASPFPPGAPKNPDDLIIPARDGTLRVLRAVLGSGARRVVVTSSTAAVRSVDAPSQRPLTEDDWADPGDRKMGPYARSKTIAERSAWDYAGSVDATDRLTVVNPSAIIGPLLGRRRSYSLQTVERVLDGGMPALPRLGFALVDVRDVADLHIRAMSAPAAAGQRLLGAGSFLWLADIAAILREELGAQASKVPTRRAPNALVRVIATFDPSVRPVLNELGRRNDFSTEKARTLLGWTPRPARDSVLDCARSILEQRQASRRLQRHSLEDDKEDRREYRYQGDDPEGHRIRRLTRLRAADTVLLLRLDVPRVMTAQHQRAHRKRQGGGYPHQRHRSLGKPADQAECLDQGGPGDHCDCRAPARQLRPDNQHSREQEDPCGGLCHQEYGEGNAVNINHGRRSLPPHATTRAVAWHYSSRC